MKALKMKAVKERKVTSPRAAAPVKGRKGKVTHLLPSAATNGTTKGNSFAGVVWNLGEVALGRIFAGELNWRKSFGEESLRELAGSLTLLGQAQNILVRPRPAALLKRLKSLRGRTGPGLGNLEVAELAVVEVLAGQQVLAGQEPDFEAVAGVLAAAWMEFEIVAGERRWRASGPDYADLKGLRCECRCLTNEEVTEFQAAENLKRSDLTAMEEGEGYARLKAQGWSVARMAERFGKGESTIFDRLKLARLEGKARGLVESGEVPPSVGALIASVPGKAAQEMLVSKDRNGGGRASIYDWNGTVHSVRAIQEVIEKEYMRPIPWKLEEVFDGYAQKEAVSPACRDCPQMTRNMTETNPELVKGPARCMGLECFKERAEAVGKKMVKGLKGSAQLWDKERFEEDRYKGGICVEGESHYGGNGMSQRWEKIAGETEPSAVAVTDDGVKRVWFWEDLVKAGVLKKESGGRGERPKSAAGVKEEREKTRFENLVREQAKVDVIRALRGELVGWEDVIVVEAAVLRHFVERSMGYKERQGVKLADWSRTQCFERLAEQAFKCWWSFGDAPEIVKELGINLAMLKERVKASQEGAVKLTRLKDLVGESAKFAEGVEENEEVEA